MRALYIICILLLWPALIPTARAQDTADDQSLITFGETVIGTITEASFFDVWLIEAAAGDEIELEMSAALGLEPLLGLTDPGGNLIARTPDEAGALGATITLDYRIPETGTYGVVATRVGNEAGTSTGDYRLTLRRAGMMAPPRINPYQEVEFRCGDQVIASALNVQFADDPGQTEGYVIRVFGLGDFDPIIRISFDLQEATDCAGDPRGMGGTTVTLPGEAPFTLADPLPEGAAQLSIGGGVGRVGTINLTVGSVDGAPGRFLVVIEGFVIDPATDTDLVRVGPGPLASRAPLDFYMVAAAEDRLDPSMELMDPGSTGAIIICEDAGRRDCPDVPAIAGLRIAHPDLPPLTADRFDAGARIGPGSPDLHPFILGSFRAGTAGRYSLVLMGELPPRAASGG